MGCCVMRSKKLASIAKPENFVGQLRKKIEPDASSPRYIQTEPWVGYRFEPGN